jgi:outer membrane protein assembly factor BamB
MGDKPGYLFDKHGRLVRSHPLKFGNGRRIELREGTRLDTQSRHWISTGNELDRLDDFGTVVQSVGNQPRRAGLGKISHLKVGTDGRIYALDAETSGVHVFDWKGHSLFTCQPKPKEFAAESSQLDVTRSGDIYIEGSYLDGSLHYSPAGKRMGYVPFADGTGRELAVSPKPTWRWFGSELIDERSKVVTRLRRFPDQRWMTGEIAMAPDGRIAAYERPSYFERQGQPLRLAFYTMATRPEGQVFLPAEMPEVFGCAYDGNRCYFVTQKGLLAVDRKGKLVWRYQPPNWTTEWKAFPSMGKIALYDGDHTVRWIEKGPAK